VGVPGRRLITCTGGAEGKCVRFGYKPWRQAADGSSLAPYYQTCVRLARADYCGDGVGHTRNGTPIDLFDHIGIQRDEPAPGMTFEAGWGKDGAVCVSHTRLPDVLSTAALAELCPDRVARTCDLKRPRRCCSTARSALRCGEAPADGRRRLPERSGPEYPAIVAFRMKTR
jgi:ADYC domain